MPSNHPERLYLLNIPLEIRLRIYDLLFDDISLCISAFSRRKTLEELLEVRPDNWHSTGKYSEQSRREICKVHASLTGAAVLLTCRQMSMETPSLLPLCQTLVLQTHEIDDNKTFLPILLASLAYSWSSLHPALSGIQNITTLVLEHEVAGGLWEQLKSLDLHDSPRGLGSPSAALFYMCNWHDLPYLLKFYENISQMVLRWRCGAEFQDFTFSRAQCLDTYYTDTALWNIRDVDLYQRLRSSGSSEDSQSDEKVVLEPNTYEGRDSRRKLEQQSGCRQRSGSGTWVKEALIMGTLPEPLPSPH